MKSRLTLLFGAALVAFLPLLACSDDTKQDGDAIPCGADELYDHVNDTCVPRPANNQTPGPDVGPGGDEDTGDGDDDVVELPDVDPSEPDVGEEDADVYDPHLDPECDQDGDGELSYACGGLDCDDNDPRRHPGHYEVCDGIDNNCNGIVDEFLECTFYAHTNDALYKINPFQKTANKESDLVDREFELVRLLDIDTHPSGTLYGNTREALFAYYDEENYWIKVASLSGIGDANGLAIDNGGMAYITAEDKIYRIDLTTVEETLANHGFVESRFRNTRFQPTPITISGGRFYSSGDSVVNKQNTLYMTSKEDGQPDQLVEIDRTTGRGTAIGSVGYSNVFGLTAGWEKLYGTTSGGHLITIDQATGEGVLLHVFEGKRWYGAASTPHR